MDSWTEPQIQAMRLGGNQKLKDWFASKGVSMETSIAERYCSPAAELYALRLRALRDGVDPPEELPPNSFSLRNKGNIAPDGDGAESTLERELRLRREAEERLRAKFGAGGLRGNALSSKPLPKGMHDDGGNSSSHFGNLPVNIDAEDLKNNAEQALNTLSSAFTTFGITAKEKFTDLSKQAESSEALQDLKSKTQESFSTFSSSVSSLWSSVSNEYSKLSSGGTGSSAQRQAGFEETAEEIAEREAAKERLRAKFGDEGLKGNGISSSETSTAASEPAPSTTPPVPAPLSSENAQDERWLKQQMEEANQNISQPRSTSKQGPEPTSSTTAPMPERKSTPPEKKPPTDEDFFADFGV